MASSPKPVYVCGYSLRLAASSSPAELHETLRNKANAVQADSSRFPLDEFQVPKFARIKQDIDAMDTTFFGINGGQAQKLEAAAGMQL